MSSANFTFETPMSPFCLGLTSVSVVQAFAGDLERLYTGFSTLDANVVLAANRNGQTLAASLDLDDAQINRLLLQVNLLHSALQL